MDMKPKEANPGEWTSISDRLPSEVLKKVNALGVTDVQFVASGNRLTAFFRQPEAKTAKAAPAAAKKV